MNFKIIIKITTINVHLKLHQISPTKTTTITESLSKLIIFAAESVFNLMTKSKPQNNKRLRSQ